MVRFPNAVERVLRWVQQDLRRADFSEQVSGRLNTVWLTSWFLVYFDADKGDTGCECRYNALSPVSVGCARSRNGLPNRRTSPGALSPTASMI